MEKARGDYLLSVQLLRGIAAFMVLLCHSSKDIVIPPGNFVGYLLPLGAGVETFLVISGFIIPYSMYRAGYRVSDFRQFMFKRIVRLEPPYIVSIILVLTLNYFNTITPWYHGPAYSIKWGFVLGHLAYINAFTGQHWLVWAYWTLAVEFQFYLLLALIFPLLTSPNKKVMIATFYSLLLLSFCVIPSRPYLIFQYLTLFLIGISLFLLMTGKVSVKEFYFLLVPAYVTFCLTGTGNDWHETISSAYVCYKSAYAANGGNWWASVGSAFSCYGTSYSTTGGNWLACVCSLGALPCIYYIRRVPKFFMWLGSISYSLYLTHMFLITRFMGILSRFSKLGFVTRWAITICLCVFVAWVFYLLFERPFVHLSKRIKIRQHNKDEATPVANYTSM